VKGSFFAVAQEIGALVEAKNRAYGSSFAKSGDFLRLLYPAGLRPDQYDDALLQVRIFDKQMRIATDRDAFGESPYRDMAGYGILGATMRATKGANSSDHSAGAAMSETGVQQAREREVSQVLQRRVPRGRPARTKTKRNAGDVSELRSKSSASTRTPGKTKGA